ncbi:MAG: PspC domain-containing protein [Bacteroidales bacterium]|nr:PspC domain-containing protein [Bacteroidales bacterium]
MKKVVNACIGGRSFPIDEDAYARLASYLDHFKANLSSKGGMLSSQVDEVMEDIEQRICELFSSEVGQGSRVVNLALVEKVVSQLGMPDGSTEPDTGSSSSSSSSSSSGSYAPKDGDMPKKKLYRNVDDKTIAGICSGLAIYLDLDPAIVKIVMLVVLLMASAGFWIYIILWFAVPKAVTPAQKCEMYGLPVTAENMARFSSNKK